MPLHAAGASLSLFHMLDAQEDVVDHTSVVSNGPMELLRAQTMLLIYLLFEHNLGHT